MNIYLKTVWSKAEGEESEPEFEMNPEQVMTLEIYDILKN
jgi:hypothetical protein